jgi:Amt family ammonium transporter
MVIAVIDTGDTAWVLAATALVLFMTPGLALFYGGMVRAKHVLAMLMQNFFTMGLVAVLWAVVCYSLAFGNFGDGGWLGDFENAFMRNFNGEEFGTIPLVLFMAFQMTFAVITPALMTGAIADRMRFSAWVWLVAIWSIVVYAPVAHWVFAGGWLAERGALDFAGGTVVHVNAGAGALAAILALGVRRGWPGTPMPPHSLPLTLLGTGILWFGWFGFNAGSALGRERRRRDLRSSTRSSRIGRDARMARRRADPRRARDDARRRVGRGRGPRRDHAVLRLRRRDVADLHRAHRRRVCCLACSLKFSSATTTRSTSSACTSSAASSDRCCSGSSPTSRSTRPAPTGVFLGGGWSLFGEQVLAVAVVAVFSFVVTYVICIALKTLLPGGIRATEQEEITGLDLTLHSEVGYSFADR